MFRVREKWQILDMLLELFKREFSLKKKIKIRPYLRENTLCLHYKTKYTIHNRKIIDIYSANSGA
jgi:hypothetical protein